LINVLLFFLLKESMTHAKSRQKFKDGSQNIIFFRFVLFLLFATLNYLVWDASCCKSQLNRPL